MQCCSILYILEGWSEGGEAVIIMFGIKSRLLCGVQSVTIVYSKQGIPLFFFYKCIIDGNGKICFWMGCMEEKEGT